MFVIPAKAGIQLLDVLIKLDSGFRRNDEPKALAFQVWSQEQGKFKPRAPKTMLSARMLLRVCGAALARVRRFARKTGLAAVWDKYGSPDSCKRDAATGDYVCV